MKRLAAIVVLSLGACAEFPLLDPAGGGVDRSVAEALAAVRGTPAQQRAALDGAEARFAREGSVASRLQLATLLAALPQPLRDDARAAQLLEPIADPASPGTGRFAAFLALQLAERQRLSREVERLAREAERAGRERDRLDRERAAADKERDKREEALRQQLEALRAIERNILEREERLRRRAR